MRRWGVLGLALLIGLAAASAAELAGVQFADQVTVGDQTLVLNGTGLRKKLVIKVYAAGLYVPSRSSNPAEILEADGAKRIVMHFLTNKATKDRMDEAWVEGFEANSPAIYPAIADRVSEFIGLFGDMKDGDEVVLTYQPGSGTTVELNGRQLGEIAGDDFGRALLEVWLGDHPPSDDLKAGLLGG